MAEPKTISLNSLGGKRRAGFSMVELLVVMLIAAALASITFTGIRSLIPRWRLNNAARTLRADLLDAKTRAAREMREVRVRFLSTYYYRIERGNAPTASTVWTMSNDNGEIVNRSVYTESEHSVTINTGGSAQVIIFRPNGTIDPTNGNAIVRLTNGTEQRSVEVSMAGRVRIM